MKESFIRKLLEVTEKQLETIQAMLKDELLREELNNAKEGELPTNVQLIPENDLCWSIVPLGVARSTKNPEEVKRFGWPLNDHEVDTNFINILPSTSLLIAGCIGSGKTVVEKTIVSHFNRFSDHFQVVAVDPKMTEFTLFRGMKGINAVITDVYTAAQAVQCIKQMMLDRFKMMEANMVNHISKIKDLKVDYYTYAGKTYQFDELFQVSLDFGDNQYIYGGSGLESPTSAFPNMLAPFEETNGIMGGHRQTVLLPIGEIYKLLNNKDFLARQPRMPERKGYNSYLAPDSIQKTEGIYTMKNVIFLADEFNELMNSDNYRAVNIIKESLGSIARLGRAAGVHLVLGVQRVNGATISTDLKNNIQFTMLLGGFDSSASVLCFEEDYSALSRPDIPGHGVAGWINEVYEIQTGWYPDIYEFDEDLKVTYRNPNFKKLHPNDLEQLDTGWVEQTPYDVSTLYEAFLCKDTPFD